MTLDNKITKIIGFFILSTISYTTDLYIILLLKQNANNS